MRIVRIAFVGKGGAGKSAIAGTFARALARRGRSVLAVDSDPMPGLAFSLGLRMTDAPIPDDAVEEKPEGEPGPRYRLRAGLSAAEAVEKYAVAAPDGVRFLQFGKVSGTAGSLVRSQFAFRQIVGDLPEDASDVVGDLPGGTRQPFMGWGGYAKSFLLVVDPTAASLLSARRLARLAQAPGAPVVRVVVNRVREPSDIDLVRQRTGLEVVAAVPWDPDLAAAEQAGRAPVDADPAPPAVTAVEALVDRLIEEDIT